MNSSPKLLIEDFKFGIEIEINIDPAKFARAINLPRGWRYHYEHCGTEIVSPILIGYKGLLAVRRVLRKIHKGFKKVSTNNAGLHIHIDIQHFLLRHAKRLVRIAKRFDDVIFAIMDGSRFSNKYCTHVNVKEKDINKCRTIADLQKLQPRKRYSCINFYAFPKHGTVEFRYARATLDWRETYALCALYLRMVALAGSTLSIPMRTFERWQSAGYKEQKRKIKELKKGKKILFNILQIKGGVRDVLDELFAANKNKVIHEKMSQKLNKKNFPMGLRSKN